MPGLHRLAHFTRTENPKFFQKISPLYEYAPSPDPIPAELRSPRVSHVGPRPWTAAALGEVFCLLPPVSSCQGPCP